mmetsp:Transcript_43664/g.103034  ORF Transcript_43664/g.103034 Transcript_43664/m.103034 type:complete len:596 (-) Transcript_43664:154-1941(-)
MAEEAAKAAKGSLPEGVDAALQAMQGVAQKWYSLPDRRRAGIARACRRRFTNLEKEWVKDELRAMGIDPANHYEELYNTLHVEAYKFVSVVAERLEKVAEALDGKYVPGCSRVAKGRQTSDGLQVFNCGNLASQQPGAKLEVWADMSGNVREHHTEGPHSANGRGVCLVLGGSGISYMSAIDVIDRIFLYKECVLYKHNPIKPMRAFPFEKIFMPLYYRGVFAQCFDHDLKGAHSQLLIHPAIKHIHVTGKVETHNTIMATLTDHHRKEDVTVTSMLGCVSPWILCPGSVKGQWKDSEIKYHATMLSACLKKNCGALCWSPKVLVLPTQEVWPQRHQFLRALRKQLAEVPQVSPYHPDAQFDWNSCKKEHHGHCEELTTLYAQKLTESLWEPFFKGQCFKKLGVLWIDVGTLGKEAKARRYALEKEALAPILVIATVDSKSPEDFPVDAAKAVNEHLGGNLSCVLIYPDPADKRLDAAVSTLEYGVVCVNTFQQFAYSNPLARWGSPPKAYSEESPGSGFGAVGNIARIPGACKTVALAPFIGKRGPLRKPMQCWVADCLWLIICWKWFLLIRLVWTIGWHMQFNFHAWFGLHKF